MDEAGNYHMLSREPTILIARDLWRKSTPANHTRREFKVTACSAACIIRRYNNTKETHVCRITALRGGLNSDRPA